VSGDLADALLRIAHMKLSAASGLVGTRFLARSQQTSIGELEVHVVGDGEIRIAWVWVREDWRSQGVASTLFARALDHYPQAMSVRATAESPEGRVFMRSMEIRHAERSFHVLEEVSSHGEPESREDDW